MRLMSSVPSRWQSSIVYMNLLFWFHWCCFSMSINKGATPMWVIIKLCGVQTCSTVLWLMQKNKTKKKNEWLSFTSCRSLTSNWTWCNSSLSAAFLILCKQQPAVRFGDEEEKRERAGDVKVERGWIWACSENTWGDKSGADRRENKVCVCVDSEAWEDLIT